MVTVCSITDTILQWKAERQAVILAHYYQEPEMQELADVVGDPIQLAEALERSGAATAVVCGVRFIAEIVQVLNPGRTVLLPSRSAGCSLADSCPVEAVRAFRRRHPEYAVVSYLNTSAEVKAESDITCTAENAVRIVNSIPARQPVLFLPDIHLGGWVQKQTGRKNMKVWQGACIVHATIPGRRLTAARLQFPDAPVAAHPECSAELLRAADFVGSPGQILAWCERVAAPEFILTIDSGLEFALRRRLPQSRFHFLQSDGCHCSECPYARENTLERLLGCLEGLSPRIELDPKLMERARLPLERMLQAERP